MFDPNTRSLYTESLRPPPEYVFDQGIATTYSLDLTTLLSVPLHLALFSTTQPGAESADGIELLESLRRVATRLAVYCQQGEIHAPRTRHVLYGMLEQTIVEAQPPRDRLFHPKLWVLRFTHKETGKPLLRLMVLSRNITEDRSWDISLLLEGNPVGRRHASNRELAELIEKLPSFAAREIPETLVKQAGMLGDEIRRTPWQLPGGFDEVRFHALGLRRRWWSPPDSRRLAVVSPFCTGKALEKLAGTTGDPVALISRAEELAKLAPEALEHFRQRRVLDEIVEVEGVAEEGAEGKGPARGLRGLHAKAYIAERGWDTHVLVGSANATGAVFSGHNVELVAEMVGKRSKVGGIEDLLGPDGLGEMLVDFVAPEEPSEPEDEIKSLALTRARASLMTADPRLECQEDEGFWRIVLIANEVVVLQEVVGLRAWPVTLAEERAVDASPLERGEPVTLPRCTLESITGLIAFELVAGEERLRFALNLQVDGLPEGRESAWLHTIVSDRDAFLRYLFLLLAENEDSGLEPGAYTSFGGMGGWNTLSMADGGLPLLEELVRTLGRDPERLNSISRVVRELREIQGDEEIVPAEFLEMWRVFESVLEGKSR